MKFIYVMDEDSVDELVRRGYNLLKKDERNSVWVFSNKDTACFDLEIDIPYVMSDTLTF